MNYSLINEEIKKMQLGYKDLLIDLLPVLKSKNCLQALDAINLFWVKNIDLVNVYLEYVIAYNDSYIFTAATYMDIDDDEHLPFLLLGKMHVFDDPLSKYALSIVKAEQATQGLMEQVILTAEDNIKIIEKCADCIVVFPIRLLNQVCENKILVQASEQFFVSLFKDIESIPDFIKKCNSFEDINRYIKDAAKQFILFSKDEDITTSFEKRYFIAKESSMDSLIDCSTDGIIFFTMVFGPIQQAIDILLTCLEYRIIPLIRYKVAFHYILYMCDTFMELPFTKELKFKLCVAYVVYNICDKEQLRPNHIDKYIDIIQKEGFSDNLFKDLKKNNVDENNFSLHSIKKISSLNLDKLYPKLN